MERKVFLGILIFLYLFPVFILLLGFEKQEAFISLEWFSIISFVLLFPIIFLFILFFDKKFRKKFRHPLKNINFWIFSIITTVLLILLSLAFYGFKYQKTGDFVFNYNIQFGFPIPWIVFDQFSLCNTSHVDSLFEVKSIYLCKEPWINNKNININSLLVNFVFHLSAATFLVYSTGKIWDEQQNKKNDREGAE